MLNRRIRISEHARRQARRRGIDLNDVIAVAAFPEQIVAGRGLREVRQRRLTGATGRVTLIRVVVESAGADIRVVTVYRTSQVAKYWGAP